MLGAIRKTGAVSAAGQLRELLSGQTLDHLTHAFGPMQYDAGRPDHSENRELVVADLVSEVAAQIIQLVVEREDVGLVRPLDDKQAPALESAETAQEVAHPTTARAPLMSLWQTRRGGSVYQHSP